MKLCLVSRSLFTLLVFGALIAPEARAQSSDPVQQRDYCPDRPSLGTPPCTIEPGRVAVEIGLAEWTRETNGDARTDTSLVGDTLVRVGLSHNLEALFGWTAFGYERARDRASGQVEKASRIGDGLIGFKANMREPDGSGFSAAFQAYVTVPLGRTPIGAGDWGGGVIVPVTFDLSPSVNLQFAPEVQAAVDEDGRGRHLAYGGVVGLEVDLSDALNVTFELAATRDKDPASRTTQSFGAVSLGWMAAHDFQLDLGATLGLNHAAPDVQVSFGVARLF